MNTTETPTTYRPSLHPLAIVSLILSILGLLPILPLIGSIAGIITGMIARREIRNNPNQYTGDGTAKAGIILGWIGIGLICLVAIALILFLIPMRSSGIQTGPAIMITVQP